MTGERLRIAALVLTAAALSLARPTAAVERVPAAGPPEVQQEIERLRATSPDERGEACLHLGSMGPKAAAAIPFLTALLGDTKCRRDWIDPQGPYTDHPVGILAAEALAQIGPLAAGTLMRALHSPSVDVRLHAVSGLWRMRDPPIDALFAVLKESDPAVRASAALALAEICREGTHEVSLKRLVAAMDDAHAPVRENLVRAISRVPVRERADPLIAALKDPDARVRQGAVAGLALFRGDAPVREALLAAVGDKDPEVRLTVITALSGAADDRVVDLFLAALKDGRPDIRQAAARSLGATRAARALGPLEAALSDPDAGVRATVTRALAESGGRAAVPVLVGALKDPDAYVRQEAASALADMRDPAATEPLIAAMGDASGHVRRMAARGLARFGDTRALDPLIAALTDQDGAVREEAAEGLARLADPRAVPALVEALKPDYSRSGLRPTDMNEPARGMKDRVAAALVKIGKPAIDPLIVLLEQAGPEDRRWPGGASYAAEALKKITGQDFGPDGAKWRAWRGEHPLAPGAAG